MRKLFYLPLLLMLLAGTVSAQNTAAQTTNQKKSAAFLQAQQAAQQSTSATDARVQASRGFDASGPVTTTGTVNPKKSTLFTSQQNAQQNTAQKQQTAVQKRQAAQTQQATTSAQKQNTQTATQTQPRKYKKLDSYVPPAPSSQNTQTQKQAAQTKTTAQTKTVAQTQKQSAQTATQTQSAQKKTAAQTQKQTAAQKNTTVKQQNTQTKQAATTTQAIPAQGAAVPNTAYGLPPIPKANLKPKQRTNTADLVQSNQLKAADAARRQAQEPADPEKYGRQRHVHLKDYQVIHQEPITQEQVDRSNARNLIRRVREDNYVMTPEEEKFVDSVLQKIQDEEHQKWQQFLKDVDNNRSAANKRINKGSLAPASFLAANKSLNTNKKWTNNTVNNALLNSVGGATPRNAFTSAAYTPTQQKPYLYTTKVQKQAKAEYEKKQAEHQNYLARQQRIKQAKEAAGVETEEQKEARLAAEESARRSENMQQMAEQQRLCSPAIKNASGSACALCCMHPKTGEMMSAFNPKIHEMVDGYIDSRDNECHCQWVNKRTSDYDTRNTSDTACTAYCQANPTTIKGYDPSVNKVHYGKLNRKKECQCFLMDKNQDICSSKAASKNDSACAACCYQKPNNTWNAGFDPKIHINTGGYVRFPKQKNIRYCECTREYRAGEDPHDKALVLGKYTNHKTALWTDEPYVQHSCDESKVNSSQGACTACCAVNTPQPPAHGYVFDYGFLKDGQCKCHFRNTNEVGVCDPDAMLASDQGCTRCCEAQPPAGFDPDTHEITYGEVVGKECKCHWRTQQRILDAQREAERAAYDPCDHKDENTGDCFACCEKRNTDSSRVLANAGVEYGRCKCYFKNRMSSDQIRSMIGSMSPF